MEKTIRLRESTISKDAVYLFDWDTFKKNLDKLITGISKNTITPINGERWEEVIYTILTHMKLEPGWNPGSHKPGADLWFSGFSISAKSGNFQGGHLNISSYRLTRFSTLEKMKVFIDSVGGKNYDIHLCCARTDHSDGSRNYKVYVVDAGLFKAKDLAWSEMKGKRTTRTTGWRGVHENGIVVEIRKKMSNQLWLSYPLELCNLISDVSISKEDLGSEANYFLLK